jgi:hypothetical protein
MPLFFKKPAGTPFGYDLASRNSEIKINAGVLNINRSLASAAHTVDAFRTLLMFSTPAFIFISEFLLAR